MSLPIPELLREGARSLGVGLDAIAVARLCAYIDLLLKWSRRVDLTAHRTPERVASRLVLDALAAVPLIPRGASVVDVGSGNGALGIALKAARSDLTVTLVEVRQRRAAFLRATADLGIATTVVEARAEDGTVTYDVAASRAFARLDAWLSLGARLVRRPDGMVLAWLARPSGRNATSAVSYDLPDGHRGHVEGFHVEHLTIT